MKPQRLLVLLLPSLVASFTLKGRHSPFLFRAAPNHPSNVCLHSTTAPQQQQPQDSQYFTALQPKTPPSSSNTQRITLTRYLQSVVKEESEFRDLESLLLSIQMACKTISNLVNRAGLVYGTDRYAPPTNNATTSEQVENALLLNSPYSDGRFYSMTRLDQLSTQVLRNALQFTGKVLAETPVSSKKEETPAQHQPGVLLASTLDSQYVACLDPLDGSGNADASICTGTVFGVFCNNSTSTTSDSSSKPTKDELVQAVLQPAKHMRAAGYCLYSSATVLVLALQGRGVQGFTLDPTLNEFVLTHPHLTIPPRGNVYSCNEANSEGWSDEWKNYLKALKTGDNQSGTRYAHRYVGSMVGDIHRTLLYGGIFGYPSDSEQHPHGNLQLLYKSSPMAFVVHQAGGKSTDGVAPELLEVRPERVHQKSPCFMGSPEDIDELKTYLKID